MGAWGVGVFENDESLDLLDDLADEEKSQVAIQKLLRRSVVRSVFLTSWTGQQLVALAAVALGDVPDDDEDVAALNRQAVVNVQNQMTPRMYARLRKLVTRVVNGPRSEMTHPELWLDAGDQSVWKTEVVDILNRLPS